jgi:hypothetical protein
MMTIEKKKTMLQITAACTMIAMLPFFAYAQVASDGHTDHLHEPVVAVEAVSDGHTDHTHGEAVVSGVGDGHTDHTHTAGGSDLLKAWSSRWWGLLVAATLLTSGLSFLVWKYLQVAPIKKTVAPSTEVTK